MHRLFTIIFDAMQSLNENGILVLASVTGGGRKTDQVPSDLINQMFVLGNRAMVGTVNAARENFEAGIKDLALCEAMYAGWLPPACSRTRSKAWKTTPRRSE